MKKKLLVSAIAATTASAGAFAAIDIHQQDATDAPRIASGGTVAFEDQVIEQGALDTKNLSADDVIVLALPTGANFVGTPTATVSAAGSNGLSLQANDLGDPGQVGKVTLVDTNNDGMNDRASVIVAGPAAPGDQVVWSGSLTWTGDSTKVAQLNASIFVDDEATGVEALRSNSVLAVPVASLTTPLGQLDSNAAITIPNETNGSVTFSTGQESDLILTVPAGTAAGETIIVSLGTGLLFNAGSIAAGPVVSLTDGAPDLASADGTSGDNQWTFTVGGAADSELERDSQYIISINDLNVTKTSGGAVAATLSGTAGLTGSATVAVLGTSGSTASVPTGAAANLKIVAGAEVLQPLPTITITETFGGDIGGTGNITITAGPGLNFDPDSTVSASGAGFSFGTATATKSLITIPVTGNTNDFPLTKGSIAISGIDATASSSASGSLNVQLGGSAENAPNSVVNVATAVARGAVEIEVDAVNSVGSGATTDAVITLDEETYAAINASSSNTPIIVITPQAGVTINNVIEGDDDPMVEDGLDTITDQGVKVIPENGSWLLYVTGETDSPSEAEITINYTVASTVPVGTDIVFTLSGNAGVDGSVTVATVSNSTKTTVGAIPAVSVGDVNFQDLAPLTITENMPSAFNANAGRSFRIIAPSGVTFASPVNGGAESWFSGSVIPTGSLASTFNANDTLVVTLPATSATGAVESITVDADAFIAGSVAKDQLLSFTIADGDVSGGASTKAGITGSSVGLAYTGDVEALEVGAGANVNVGFSLQRTIEGGLEGEGFTVSSSNEAVAEAEVNGRTITVRGLTAGTSDITVTDSLGGTDSFRVTVEVGAEQEELTGVITSGGAASSAVLRAGASVDGGNSYETEFSTDDVITVVGSIEPEAEHVGEPGELFVVVRALVGENNVWGMLNEDGNWQLWDARPDNLEGLVPAVIVDSLAEVEHVDIHNDTLPAGTYRIRVGYMAEGGQLIFNENPLEIVVE